MIALRHSGDSGDIISSLLYIKTAFDQPCVLYLDYKHEDRIIYKENLKFNKQQFDQLVPVLLSQPYIDSVYKYNGQNFDVDCNMFREYIFDNNCALTDMYFMNTDAKPVYSDPWLYGIGLVDMQNKPNIIHRNFRYRSDNIDWEYVMVNEGLIGTSWFVGSVDEYLDFLSVSKLCSDDVPHLVTNTISELCNVVNSCTTFYGTGGLPLCIAHALAKPVVVEVPFMPPGHKSQSEPAKHNIIIRENARYYNHYDTQAVVDLTKLYKYNILT